MPKYAMPKANSNQAVIGLFASMGAGADVVSEGELRRMRWRPVSHPARLFLRGWQVAIRADDGVGSAAASST